MKVKLNESFGTRTRELFVARGHEVETVRDEGLQGCADDLLYEVCTREGHCLVTLDLDFTEVIRFPPYETSGIAVIRVSQNPSLALLQQLINQFLQAITQMSIDKQLWIVEPTRIRIHSAEELE